MKVKEKTNKKSTIDYSIENDTDEKIVFHKEPLKEKKQRFLHKEKKTSRDIAIHENKTIIDSRTKFTVLIAILLYFISFLGNNNLDKLEFLDLSFDFIFNFMKDVASVILGMSLGAMSLDFFSYVRYSQERIKEVMIDKKFLKSVKDEEKKNMISTLESSLYFNDGEIPPDSLYANIREKIIPLLEEEYEEEHFLHIDCFITDTYIKKVCTNMITIISPKNIPAYSLPFEVVFKPESEVSGQKALELKDLIVNRKSIVVSDATPKITSKGNVYCFNNSFELKKGKNTISYQTISYVKLNENTYSHTVSLPCKHYTIEMYTDNQDYEIYGNGFCIDKSKIMSKHNFPYGCRLDFNDWIIPGDGCLFVINKK